MRTCGLVRFAALLLVLALAGGAISGQAPGATPAGGILLIVTVHVSTAGGRAHLYRIDGLRVVRGTLPSAGRQPGGSGAAGAGQGTVGAAAGDGAPGYSAELVVRDRGGRIVHQQEFSYPEAVTIPPLPPGMPDDGVPARLSLDEQDVALAVPYLDAADSVEVRGARDAGPSASRRITDDDRRLPDGLVAREARPVVALPGSLGILILSSGYLPEQMDRFRARAGDVRDAILKAEPFAAQRASVRVTFHESQDDLGCYTGCSGIERMMCCNTANVISAAVASGAAFDEIIVIHNTPVYAGFGRYDGGGYKTNSYGSMCGVYDGAWTGQVALHEFGHSFGSLCDEYALDPGTNRPVCVNCRPACEELLFTPVCTIGCDTRPDYVRPEASVMLSLDYGGFNRTSIESTLLPDGLRVRLGYFTGIVAGTGSKGQFPPRDEVLVFRETLEAYYRDTLRRTPGPSHVDVEGEAVWIPEYLRYRLTQCTHGEAVQRVLAQIAGYGVQPGCGGVSEDYAFPPRDQTLAFRIELEDLYRVDLNRSPGPTAVDIEGNAVWLQEYLRYRLHGCSHAVASMKVMLQIQGQGIQPVCY